MGKFFLTIKVMILVVFFMSFLAPRDGHAQSFGPTVCTGASLPANAVTLDFAAGGVNWPGGAFSSTFNNIAGQGVSLTASISPPPPGGNTFESNTFPGNGDTAVFATTSGFGAGSSTINLDISANPSSLLDFCVYHINWSGGGGDQVTVVATTNLGTVLSNPVLGTPSGSNIGNDYIVTSPNNADAIGFTSGANGLLGVQFSAPPGEQIVSAQIVWRENSASAGGFHGLGFGQISFSTTNPIDAVDDTVGAVNGFAGGDTASVLANDTLGGVIVDPADINLTPGTAPTPAAGSITMNADGTITVAPGTSAGTYSYSYTICEATDPTNCDTATATVVVDPAPIDAVDDTLAAVNGFAGGDTTSVLANDTLNGVAVDPADITLTPGTAPTPAAGSITMNADGTITVAPGTTAGTYSYPYQICDILDPTNCDTATATVTVDPAPIDAIDDTMAAVNGFAGGDTASVLVNDTLNGVVVDPADVTVNPGTAPTPASGSITMNADGTITVAPGTTAGTYSYPYEICETLNSTNCDTATATVVVDPAPIDAVDDTMAPIVGLVGGDTPSVLVNDTLNGVAVDPADITLTPGIAPTPAAGSISMNADGTITVAPGTTPGTYSYPYQICEDLNASNCDTATATVVVGATPIDAVDDTLAAVNGLDGGDTASVLDNDTLNNLALDPADINLTPGTAPTPAAGSISMNPDGTITVAPGTTAGSYSYPYTICEATDPTNCDTATATVVVDPAPIDAVDDTMAAVNGLDGGDTASVLVNDTLNGVVVDPADIALTPGTAPTPAVGSISMNSDGTITIAPGTTAGTYSYPYTICENLNSSNCDTATATVVVDPAPIDAVDDTMGAVNGFVGGDTASVLVNDTLNGVVVDPADIALTPGTAPTPAVGSISMNADGTITIAPGTTAGTYSYPYTICENLNGTNCDTATATVVVGLAPIDAVDDTMPPVNGFAGGDTASVLVNDTLNGTAVDPADIALTPGTAPTPAAGSINMNADGTITVAPGTTAGTYSYPYTICDVANAGNCDTATATVVVSPAPIDAVDETMAAVNGLDGGDTASVLVDDTLNGVAVDPADITLTPGTAPSPAAGSISMNADGTITVAPGTTAGTYSYPYQICDAVNAGNCDTATATVVVDPAPIDAVDDTMAPIVGFVGGDTPSVLVNDTLNGVGVDPADISLTPGTAPTPAAGSISMNPDGTITVAPGTTAGTYSYPYTICENLNSSNCDTATATVVVEAAPIDAVDDTMAPINGFDGGDTVSVLDNDTLNSAVVDPADITLTSGTAPSPTDGSITMNADGTITVAPGTTAGTYSYPYTICENLNSSNCDTATATVVVDAAPIDAVDDMPAPVNGFAGGDTASVLDNDTLNGVAVDPADITLTPGTAPTPAAGSITMNPDGTITVAPGTTAGSYSYPYTICDAVNPGNCYTATATVVVDAAPIDAVDDTPAPVNGFAGGDTASVLDNDTLNGVAVDPADITLTPGTAPTPAAGSITMNPDGTITVAPGTTAGSYSYPYTICDAVNSGNCDTAVATVVVDAAPIDAVDDTPAPVNGLDGGDTPSVLDNDTLNGAAVDPADITLTPGTAPTPATGSISMNPDGTITIAPGTTAGTYSYPYEICETLNQASNCDTAIATVVVSPPVIDAVDDEPTKIESSDGGKTGTVLDNDTLNGVAVDPADITLTSSGRASDGTRLGLDTKPSSGSIRMNGAGEIIIAPGTEPGTYQFTYEICEDQNPTNCDTAVATIEVEATNLLELIRDDLETILEDDLSATLHQQAEQMNSFAAGALDRLQSRTSQACLADVNARLEAENILFDTDKAIIKPDSNRILDEIAQILSTCEGSAFEIAGHTDSDASDAYNLDLSQRRVEAVLRALIARDVDTTGFIARGYGERQPIASNATAAGKAKNRRVEFRPLEVAEYRDECTDSPNAIRNFNATRNESGTSIEGDMRHESYDCARDAWSIFEGTLSHLETDQGQSQSMVNLSYRRERFTDADSVRGYFIGLYGTRNDITNLATGEIEGFGINGGIYGADRLRNGLFVDYYLGAAAGKHKFDLDFDRDIGTINAEGDYQYFALFAGAALSGEMKFGTRTVTPRFGFDFAYAPGADVSVITSMGTIQQSDVFELGEVSGGRLFLEVRDEYLVNDGNTLLALTPRIACYSSFGLEERGCGIGGSIELSSADEESDLSYSLTLDGERGNGYSSWYVRGSVAKRLRNGVLLSGEANVDENGAVGVGGAVELEF